MTTLPVEKSTAISRRALLKLLGGGILVAAAGPAAIAEALSQRNRPAMPQNISAWIHIGKDGRILVLTGKVEVGQNARTSITQAAAEELQVPMSLVTVLMGDTDAVPYDMGTFGSLTTPMMIPQIRKAAAAARQQLLTRAAKTFGVSADQLTTHDGKVWAGTRSASYGELAGGEALTDTIPASIAVTAPNEWKVLGQTVRKVDARDFVTGHHVYAVDMTAKGMLRAKVLRPPSYGAVIKSIDTSAAEAMPGVKVVRDGEFVAVAAPSLSAAGKAIAAIKVEWTEKPGQPSSKQVHAILRGTSTIAHPEPVAGAKPLSATYQCAYIAHVPLEPRAALAEWDGTRMTVHTGTQRPFGVRPEVATALGIPESQVRILVPDTGSGYGGKHAGDAAVEAAKISKALGVPVSVSWSRPEEFEFAYFRPSGVDELFATFTPDGRIAQWECDNFNSGPPGIECPYDTATPRTESHQAKSPLRQGTYRCLGATFNNFARESHVDDLAHACGLDPLAFRIRNLEKSPELQEVLKAAATKFEWGQHTPASNHGFGLACGTEKGGYVATCVEIAVDPKTKAIRVVRAVTAFQCGAILNPDLLKNQVDGAVIMGIGGALFEAIEFENGKILNPRLSKYRVPRFSDIPKMETVLIDRKDLPSAGAGEVPIMAIAPAIGNAVFQATGIRLRSMPMRLPA